MFQIAGGIIIAIIIISFAPYIIVALCWGLILIGIGLVLWFLYWEYIEIGMYWGYNELGLEKTAIIIAVLITLGVIFQAIEIASIFTITRISRVYYKAKKTKAQNKKLN